MKYSKYLPGYSIYEVIKVREDRINWKWAYEKRNSTYKELMRNKQLLAELEYFSQQIIYYCNYLIRAQNNLREIIKEIDLELDR